MRPPFLLDAGPLVAYLDQHDAYHLADHTGRVRQLMAKYAQTPMSLADACLVCMAEVHPESTVFTTDRHFRIYRKHGRTVIPVLMPRE